MSMFAGTFVSLLIYQVLVLLWRVFLGRRLGPGTDAGAQAISAAIALYVGAFIAARAPRDPLALTGPVRGLVVSALFFGTLIAVGLLPIPAFTGITPDDPRAYRAVEEIMGDVMKTPVNIQSLAARMTEGNALGARRFILERTRLPDGVARARVQAMTGAIAFIGSTQREIDEFLARTSLATLLLGAILAALGGRDGVVASTKILERKRPERFERETRAA